jgi:hypothetical protein
MSTNQVSRGSEFSQSGDFGFLPSSNQILTSWEFSQSDFKGL